ncbi:MAG: hypothetical protein M1839_004890 [Geoglossum umbratile]|nr:MAG: hypothetical protein M1839_004890 [Geoglossum umbratile]
MISKFNLFHDKDYPEPNKFYYYFRQKVNLLHDKDYKLPHDKDYNLPHNKSYNIFHNNHYLRWYYSHPESNEFHRYFRQKSNLFCSTRIHFDVEYSSDNKPSSSELKYYRTANTVYLQLPLSVFTISPSANYHNGGNQFGPKWSSGNHRNRHNGL